jgi:hypothetical protein
MCRACRPKRDTRLERRYPSCCTSAFCGRGSCEGCRDKPILDEFKAWRERVQAVQPDPIWDRGRWVATVEESS